MAGTESGEVPRVVCLFTCWVCTGVMANFTVVMPLTIYYAGHELNAAGVVSSYAVGALLSLTFWSMYDKHALKSAYLTHALVMTVGNIIFAASAMHSQRAWYGQLLARFVVGLEGGCMYNANLALVGMSSRELRVKYLSYYQSFVGLGLVLGPAISATALVISFESGHPGARSVFTGVFMSVWGVVLLAALVLYMPADDTWKTSSSTAAAAPAEKTMEAPLDEETKEPPAAPEAWRRRRAWWLSFGGNFFRIFQRLGWEVGAVVILAEYFHWGGVASGFSLSFFGFTQGVAQYLYGKARATAVGGAASKRDSLVSDVKMLELVELVGILAMFSKTPATHYVRDLFNVTFILASLLFYVASCLTSAPFNDLVLSEATAAALRQEDVLLASQYGIFFAFLCAPVAARGVFQIERVAPAPIAGVLFVGWAGQTLVNTVLVKKLESRLVAALGLGLSAVIVWASFDRAAGGTGWPSVFTYHPIFMTWAFFGAMTPGQLVYREDASLLRFFEGIAKPDLRRSHAVWMALAALFALVAYCCIFAAHFQNGESQLGVGELWSRTLHVALGYPVLAWMVLQTAVGVVKANNLNTSGTRSFAWHGASGKYLLLAAYVVAALGFWLRMNYSNQGGWGIPIKLAFTAVAFALFGFRALPDDLIGVRRLDSDRPAPPPLAVDDLPDANVPPAKDVL